MSSKQEKLIKVETYEVEEKGLCTIAVQPLEERVYDATSGTLEVVP